MKPSERILEIASAHTKSEYIDGASLLAAAIAERDLADAELRPRLAMLEARLEAIETGTALACKECGKSRNEHRQSPACRGFE